jgi:hypothetical protein
MVNTEEESTEEESEMEEQEEMEPEKAAEMTGNIRKRKGGKSTEAPPEKR